MEREERNENKPYKPAKKVISSEEIGANAFAQADMAVKEREASIVVTTPKKIFPLVRFLDLKAILSRRKELCFTFIPIHHFLQI